MNIVEKGESSAMVIQSAKRKRGRPRKDASLKQAEATQTPESSVMVIQPAKRKRGRPRKDASLKQAEAARTPESSAMVIQPAKRKRGRPRKDASLKQAEAARTPGSEGRTAYPSQRANRTRGPECAMGEAVTGFVEATFSSCYLIKIRIGNSTTYMRGVALMPGHIGPITTTNDVAPHLPMIRTDDVCFTVEKQGQSHIQTAAAVPSKRKRAPVTAPSKRKRAPVIAPSKRKRAPVHVPPVTTVATVAPQPAACPNDLQVSDYDDLMVEHLYILPPGRDIPVRQFFVPALTYPGWEAGSEQYGDGSVGQDREDHKAETATDIDNPATSWTLEALMEDAKEFLKSPPENSAFDDEPFLKASVENSSRRQLHFPEPLPVPSSELPETPPSTSDSVQGSIGGV